MNIEHLKQISNDILDICENIPTIYHNEYTHKTYNYIQHSIPLKPKEERTGKSHPLECPEDWAIDNVDEISSKVLELENYANYIVGKYCTGPYQYNFSNIDDEILPHWLVFPHYPAGTIGWRMGYGESYRCVYQSYRDSLSDEDRQKLDEQYPEPDYFKEEVIPD